MGKFKPFLFGTLAGSAVIFVALQYHVINTNEGFRVVPRTPQHSIGLAYVDMRNWNSSNFADRPEVTRALVANGLSDLVVGTVKDDLMNSVSSESPMGQLRGYLNGAAADSKSDPIFDSEDFMGIRKDDKAPNNLNADDLFSIPFDRDARSRNASPEIAQPTSPRTTVAQRAREAMNDVFNSNKSPSTGFEEVPDDSFRRSSPAPTASVPAPSTRSAADEASLLEDMLFGNGSTQKTSPAPSSPQSPQPPASDFGIFEDVTGALEDRADQALQRARTGFQSEVNRTIEDSAGAVERFTRGKIRNALPDSVSSMFPDDLSQPTRSATTTPAIPDAIKALQNGFDPFID